MEDLKKQKIWICWTLSKGTKKPISAHGTPTSANVRKHGHTYVTYEEALQAKEEKGYTGVGFVIPEGYFFLDIDHRPQDDPLCQTLFERFESYCERSQSKEGFHIYGKCDLSQIPQANGKLASRFYTNNRLLGLEIYIGGLTSRFACFTDDVFKDLPIADCTQSLLVTLRHEMLKQEVTRKHVSEVHGDDEELFDMICDCRRFKNGENFIKLYDKGDWSGYSSHSEADAALCSMLAFRIGNDPLLIDKAFRSSALYRPKWDREDYSSTTIYKSVQILDGKFYDPGYSTDCPFVYLDDKDREKIDPVKLAQTFKEKHHYLLVKSSGKENAQMFVYENGHYQIYNDNMFKGLLKELIMKYVPYLVSTRVINEAFNQLMMETSFITHEQLDAQEQFINFENGLLHLPTMVLNPHSPAVYSTIQIPCQWTGEKQETPIFDQYLQDMFGDDEESKTTLMEFLGIVLSNVPGYRMKKALFLIGDGNTGKSQIRKFADLLVGRNNSTGQDLDDLEKRFGTSLMYGKRVCGSSDLKFSAIPELNVFKKTTGGDPVDAEFKGESAFSFIYKGVLWFCGNRIPKFGGDDGTWVYDRIISLQCHNIIPEEKRDPLLLEKLYAERSGVMYKAIQAAKSVVERGYKYTEPKSQAEMRAQYRSDNNSVLSFLHECCEMGDGSTNTWCSAQTLYRIYSRWCSDNGRRPKSSREFRNQICEELNGTFSDLTKHRKTGNFYKTLIPKKETETEYRKLFDEFWDPEEASNTIDYDDLPF